MSIGRKLKLNKNFVPVQVDDEDEIYPNGIFVFNITKLVAHIKANTGNFPLEEVNTKSLPTKTSDNLNEETIRTANLANPIVLAEISPGRYNVIDGNHRLAKASREGREKILAHRITMEHHLAFLISVEAYKAFVKYWNSKLDETLTKT